MANNSNTLPNSGSESGNGSNNNLYQGPAEKGFSGDNIANGYGIAYPASEKSFETFPGSEQSEQNKLKDREIDRFNMLQSSGAMGMDVKISNAGIVLPMVDVGYGQGGTKPNIQGGANK